MSEDRIIGQVDEHGPRHLTDPVRPRSSGCRSTATRPTTGRTSRPWS